VELIELRDLLDHQCGVIARRQVLERGGAPHDLRRWLRARELVPVHAGVYVEHTGPLTWANRAWAGVQRYWPAALALGSAVHGAGEVVHVGVDAARSFPKVERGVEVHRLRDFEGRVQWNRSPPCQRLEDAVLSMCGGLMRERALELVSEVVRTRRTTPDRLLDQLSSLGTLADRRWLRGVLSDAAAGVHSVLESGYVRRVERAHGLPRGERQVREVTGQGVIYRDALYRRQRVAVELDGRLGHEPGRARWDDMERDLDAATAGLVTVRLGWRHVEFDPCRTASRLALLLQRRGWEGRPRACGPGCLGGVRGGGPGGVRGGGPGGVRSGAGSRH
jgi:hypothetical protein